MGFRIKYVVSVVLLFIFINCKGHKTSSESYNQEEYILAYKNTVLYGCLNEKTNKDFGKLMDKYKNTASREVSILFHAIYNQAESLGVKYSKGIKLHNYYGDLKGKEFIFSDCVSYAFGKEVDSIAKVRYSESKNN